MALAVVPWSGGRSSVTEVVPWELRELNYIHFKFVTDIEPSVVEFRGREISVGDLRKKIADLRKLPVFDVRIFDGQNDSPLEVDSFMLKRNKHIKCKRQPKNAGSSIEVDMRHIDLYGSHVPVVEICDDDVLDAPQDAPEDDRMEYPSEWICSECEDMYVDPQITGCCGTSACRSCMQKHLVQQAVIDIDDDAPVAVCGCPWCNRPWRASTRPISNVVLVLVMGIANGSLPVWQLPKDMKAKRLAREAEEAAIAERERAAVAEAVAERERVAAEAARIVDERRQAAEAQRQADLSCWQQQAGTEPSEDAKKAARKAAKAQQATNEQRWMEIACAADSVVRSNWRPLTKEEHDCLTWWQNRCAELGYEAACKIGGNTKKRHRTH